jgi:hypothetical protein
MTTLIINREALFIDLPISVSSSGSCSWFGAEESAVDVIDCLIEKKGVEALPSHVTAPSGYCINFFIRSLSAQLGSVVPKTLDLSVLLNSTIRVSFRLIIRSRSFSDS